MPERLTVLAVTPAGRAGRTDDLGLLPEEVAQRAAGSDVGRTARRGSGTSKMDHTWARVRRIGLDAIADTPEAEWIGTPHEAAVRRVRELRAIRVEQVLGHGYRRDRRPDLQRGVPFVNQHADRNGQQ